MLTSYKKISVIYGGNGRNMHRKSRTNFKICTKKSFILSKSKI